VIAPAAPAPRCEQTAAARVRTTAAAGEGSVLARVARERREARDPPEARGLRRDEVRMLVAEGPTGIRHARARDLPAYLRAGDVLVVNTSKTIPAALPARRADGTLLRLHLSTPAAGDATDRWVVELRRDGARFGAAQAGETLALPGGAHATLLAAYVGQRLWLATLDVADLSGYLARHGAPIRYAHTRGEHSLDAYQTIFALHPGSAEMPSAGRPFTPELVTALVARGIVVAPLTLHTGVSSLEAGELPYPERFGVPPTTARLVNAARAGGGRVIAVGTTVVRALETVALPFGHVEADHGWTRHVVTPECGVRVVDGLLTGWHDPDASHLLMLEAVGGRDLVERSYAEALDTRYRWHGSATSTSSCRESGRPARVRTAREPAPPRSRRPATRPRAGRREPRRRRVVTTTGGRGGYAGARSSPRPGASARSSSRARSAPSTPSTTRSRAGPRTPGRSTWSFTASVARSLGRRSGSCAPAGGPRASAWRAGRSRASPTRWPTTSASRCCAATAWRRGSCAPYPSGRCTRPRPVI